MMHGIADELVSNLLKNDPDLIFTYNHRLGAANNYGFDTALALAPWRCRLPPSQISAIYFFFFAFDPNRHWKHGQTDASQHRRNWYCRHEWLPR